MAWAGRLFDVRDPLVRMVLLVLAGVGYLFFVVQGAAPAGQWLLAVLAFLAGLALHRRPLVNLLVQTALLAVAIWLLDDVTINQIGASWALLELTMRADRTRIIWLAAGLLAAVDLVGAIGDPLPRFLAGVFGLLLEVGVPLLLGLLIRANRELSEQARQRAAEEQRRRDSEARAARADERSAIARELHDVVAHHVASMVLRVGVARHVLTELDPRVGAVFDDVHGTGTAALADLRRLVAVLRDPDGVRGDAALTAIEPSSLPAALGAAVDRARQAGITVEADIDPAITTVDAVRGLAVLRLTQESLTNVAKHAGTSALARLSVRLVDGAVHWEVTDNGRGTVAAVVPSGGGHGLTGMRERVEVLGGRLSAGPTGAGWLVATVLPAAPAPSATTAPEATAAQQPTAAQADGTLSPEAQGPVGPETEAT